MRRDRRLRGRKLWTIEVPGALNQQVETFLEREDCLYNTKSEMIRSAVRLLISSNRWSKKAQNTSTKSDKKEKRGET